MKAIEIREKYVKQLLNAGWTKVCYGKPGEQLYEGTFNEYFRSPAKNNYQLSIYINLNKNAPRDIGKDETVTVGLHVVDLNAGLSLTKPDFTAFPDGSKDINEVLAPGFAKIDKWCRQKIESLQMQATIVQSIIEINNFSGV